MSKTVRRIHREVTREITKYVTRLYFREGWLEQDPEGEKPDKDFARFYLRNRPDDEWSDIAWAAMEEYGFERLEGLDRRDEAQVVKGLVDVFKERADIAARKPLEELERSVFDERSAS
jgi:hypothetical protein